MEIEMQNAWNKFMQSGKINDYVAYIEIQNTTGINSGTIVSQGEINTNANNNTGLNPAGNQYR